MIRPQDIPRVWLEYQALIGEFIANHPAYMVPIAVQAGNDLFALKPLLAKIVQDHENGNEIATTFLNEAVARKLFDPFDTLTIAEIDEMDRREDEGGAA